MRWLRKLKEHRLLAALLVVAWLFLFITAFSKTYSYYIRNGLELELGFIIYRSAVLWGIAALFTPLFYWLAGRYPIEGAHWSRRLGLHFVISVVFMPVHAALYRLAIGLAYGMAWKSGFGVVLIETIVGIGFVSALVYWVVLGAWHMRTYYLRYRSRQVRTLQLEAELNSARLKALKMQLHPHFLFNTLHNVNTLLYEDQGRAKDMLVQLRTLLAASFRNQELHEIPLEKELAFTGTYLDIELTRFSDRLRVQWDIEPATREAMVPSLLLQPLVENAVRHGISKKMRPGCICISSRIEGKELVLTVADDGPGLDAEPGFVEEGVGLSNTRSRLQQLYEHFSLDLLPSDKGGTMARVVIPYRTISAESESRTNGVRSWNLSAP